MSVAAPSEAPVGALVSAFGRVEKSLPGAELPWLSALRRSALEGFAKTGFPTTRQEEWRFTPVEPVAKTLFSLPAASGEAPPVSGLPFDAHRAVFVDGRFQPALSDLRALPAGVSLTSLAECLASQPRALEGVLARQARDGQPFTALSTAFFRDGAVLRAAGGAVLDKPLHLRFHSTGRGADLVAARTVLMLEEGASASVVEEFTGGAASYLSTHACEVSVGDGARLSYAKVQDEGRSAFHAGSLAVSLGRSSAFDGHLVSLGARIARQDARVALQGEGADCSLYGLYLADDEQLMDFHTVVDHAVAHGSSRELFKGVLDGKARAVFNGLIEVRAGAQKTDAMVYNKNLLLSEQGLVNTKPEFKINANDVQCKHGATIGQISAEALFYLRSRGIGESAARGVLVYGFAREMIDRLPVPELRAALAERLAARLPEAR